MALHSPDGPIKVTHPPGGGGTVKPGESVKVESTEPGTIYMTPLYVPNNGNEEKTETDGNGKEVEVPQNLKPGTTFVVSFWPRNGGPPVWFTFEVVDPRP